MRRDGAPQRQPANCQTRQLRTQAKELIDKIIERCCSRIAINTQRANDLRIAVSHTLPPYSQRFVQFDRAHHALRQP